MDDINNIAVEDIYPQQHRNVPHAGPVRAINNRFDHFRDEVRNDRRELRDRLNLNERRVMNIATDVARIRDTCTTMAGRVNAMAVNAPQQNPPPILVNAQVEQGGGASGASSAVSSRGPSRPSSPQSVDEGLYPLARNLAYSSQVLLKQKQRKYPDTFELLKNVAGSKDQILNRITKNSDSIVKKAKTGMAEVIPDLVGLSTLLEASDYTFEERPEDEISESNGSLARKELRKEFSSLKGATENLTFLISTIISRYSRKLTFSQVKELLICLSDGKFKRIASDAFNAKSVSQAFKFLLSMYGKVQSHSDRSTQFHKTKIDPRNPVSSLYSVYENCQEAYPDKNENEITQMSLVHSLSHLPSHIVTEWNNKMTSIGRMRRLDISVPEVTFPMFIDFVKISLKSGIKFDSDRTVREVEVENKPREQDRLFDKTIKELNEFKRSSLHRENENLKALGEIQDTQSHLVASLGTLNKKISETRARTSAASGAKSKRTSLRNLPQRVGKDRSRVLAIHAAYRIDSPGFRKAAEGLKTRGSVLEVIKRSNIYNHQKRNKPHFQIHRVSNPNAPIPYEFVNDGRYVPEAGSEINFNVIIEYSEGRYTFTDQLLHWASERCIMCGQSFCGLNAVYCVYASETPTYQMCNCQLGFHNKIHCFSSTSKDLNLN